MVKNDGFYKARWESSNLASVELAHFSSPNTHFIPPSMCCRKVRLE